MKKYIATVVTVVTIFTSCLTLLSSSASDTSSNLSLSASTSSTSGTLSMTNTSYKSSATEDTTTTAATSKATTASKSTTAKTSTTTEKSTTTASATTAATTTTTSAATTTSATSTSATNLTATKSCKIDDANFDTYVSNTYVSTSNNYMITCTNAVTFRSYIPLEEYGNLNYKLFYSNVDDATYDDGEVSYVNKSGGEYTIVSAKLYDGGTSSSSKLSNATTITYSGMTSKLVSSGETFWSDQVSINIPTDHYLVYEVTVVGKNIACCRTSSLYDSFQSSDGKTFESTYTVPLPVLFGADRDVKQRVTLIGDSISQGCKTTPMKFEFWAAKISKQLGEDYAFWNCGLGYARASDAATCGSWLGRVLNTDVLLVSLGLNDLDFGEYGGDGRSTASEVNGYLTTILNQSKAENIKTILFNASPYSYEDEREGERVKLNDMLLSTAVNLSVSYFDMSSILSDSDDVSIAKYGPHPNGDGGDAVAKEFMIEFGKSITG